MLIGFRTFWIWIWYFWCMSGMLSNLVSRNKLKSTVFYQSYVDGSLSQVMSMSSIEAANVARYRRAVDLFLFLSWLVSWQYQQCTSHGHSQSHAYISCSSSPNMLLHIFLYVVSMYNWMQSKCIHRNSMWQHTVNETFKTKVWFSNFFSKCIEK